MDEFDLTPGQAEGVLRWHQSQLADQHVNACGMLLVRIFAWVLEGTRADARLKLGAMAFVVGVNESMGWATQEDAARALGASAMAVSQYVRQAGKVVHDRPL